MNPALQCERIPTHIDELSGALQLATQDVCTTMLAIDGGREIPAGEPDVTPLEHQISAEISLDRPAPTHLRVRVVIAMDQMTAKQVTAKLLACEIKEIDEDVVDAIGELCNMIVGAAKSRLETGTFYMGLPQVHFPSHVPTTALHNHAFGWETPVGELRFHLSIEHGQ